MLKNSFLSKKERMGKMKVVRRDLTKKLHVSPIHENIYYI